jgi:hypothetical protein
MTTEQMSASRNKLKHSLSKDIQYPTGAACQAKRDPVFSLTKTGYQFLAGTLIRSHQLCSVGGNSPQFVAVFWPANGVKLIFQIC